jgi:hypothetical protein
MKAIPCAVTVRLNTAKSETKWASKKDARKYLLILFSGARESGHTISGNEREGYLVSNGATVHLTPLREG